MTLFKMKVPTITQYGTLGGEIYDSTKFPAGFYENLKAGGLAIPYIDDEDIIQNDFNHDKKLSDLTASLADRAKQSVDLFNLKENGADITGINDISPLLDIAQASGKQIYLPKGTYYINYWRPASGKGKVHLVGDGESTIIKVNSIIRPYDDWIVEDIQFVQKATMNGNSIFGIDTDSNGNKHNFTMNRCVLTTEKTNSPDTVMIDITGCKNLKVSNSTFFYGGLSIKGCDYFWVRDNYFDTYFLNANEQIHANQDCSGIISGNRMFNSNTDFIDLYVNGKSMIVENNRCEGHMNACMELKVIFRDLGDPSGFGNESNLVGAWKNLIVRNNHFSGGKKGDIEFFRMTTDDFRATPVVNDYRYYGRFLTFEGNYIDDTTLDGTADSPIDANVRSIFSIRGLSNVNILNNKVVMNFGVKRIVLFAQNSTATASNSQITKNIRVEGNSFVHKYGYTSINDISIFWGGNVDGLLVKNNTFPYFSKVLYNSDFPIINAIFEANLFDNINNENLSTSVRHVWIYVGGSSITFKDMTLWGFFINNSPLTNGQNLNIDFTNCVFTNALFMGYLDVLRFTNCKFKITSGTNITFRTAVSMLYLVGCTFNSGFTGYYLDGGQYITVYFPRDIYTDTTRASIWSAVAPSIVPTKTDLTAKY